MLFHRNSRGLPLHVIFHCVRRGKPAKRLLAIGLCCLLSVSLPAQLISLQFKDVPLVQALNEIEKQTSHRFVYSSTVIERAVPVTVFAEREQLQTVLNKCLAGQPIDYEMEDKFIVLRLVDTTKHQAQGTITGKVMNEAGEGIAGVTVTVKGTNVSAVTGNNGVFEIEYAGQVDTIVVSGAEIAAQETAVMGRSYIEIVITSRVGILDETIVKGYYNTSRRLNIGTVDKVTEKTISDQAVSNPLAALQGRVPGLMITQSNGLPGGGFTVLLRGQNSLQRGTEPLFVVDGVPFNTERQTQRTLINTNNPFNIINPLDIESVEVLKDAEATAIYGSRGGNGVILITTKKGASGKAKAELNVSSAFGKAQFLPKLLGTSDYLAMRREAFKNDGITPTNANAPDLLLWDTTRYTDWVDLLLGGTAQIDKVYAKLSGGNAQTSYSFAGTYYKEGTVFPGPAGDRRYSFNTNLNYKSTDQKLAVDITTLYSYSKTLLGRSDLAGSITLPPNAPPIYDTLGRLNWRENGGASTNPMAVMLRKYETETDWMNSNLSISYKLVDGFIAKVSGGYNMQLLQETSLYPIASQDPATNPKGTASFANASDKNWILEPQLEYRNTLFNNTTLTAQIGGSYQTKITQRSTIDGSGYTSDGLIRSASGAATISAGNSTTEYKYVGVFGRLLLNMRDRYLLSLTGRRDGSSRFGEDRRFANFGGAALGWIFTQEGFFKRNVPVLSYGKIRFSYGSSGNDQIGDYLYLDTWSATQYTYNGSTGLIPTRLQNDAFHWELKTNFEAAIETGFWNNRLLFNLAYFRSISKDQLISYSLPGQTGFASVLLNFPAVIQNTGIELSANVKVIDNSHLKWSSVFNLSINRNKLLRFPGIESTSYATRVQIGQPVSVIRGYVYNGIDPVTGLYRFKDLDNDGSVSTADQYFLGSKNPSFFGGIQQDIIYRNFEFGFFFHFVKQKGTDVLISSSAGSRSNVPVELLDRWSNANENARYQKFSTVATASNTASQMRSSDAGLTDASYIKLRNVNIAYRLPGKLLRRIRAEACRIYVQGQNLATITPYKGSDPETQSLIGLAPLRVISIGLSITF